MIDRYVSPGELKRILSAGLVTLLFLGITAVFSFLVLPGQRRVHRGTPEPGADLAAGRTGWLDPTDYPPEKGRTLPPIDPATVMTPNPELLARGQALYSQFCVSCHGPKGEGDGLAGRALEPRPRNFTRQDGWQNGTGLEAIYKTLDEGIKGSAMVSFDYLAKRDRMALDHYVRSLGAFDHGPGDPKALAALAEVFARGGEVLPNRIPVPRALQLLAQEYRAPAALSLPAESPWRATIQDPVRAAATLSQIPGWRQRDEVLATIALGVPGNGFAPAVALYSPAQWEGFRRALDRSTKEDKP